MFNHPGLTLLFLDFEATCLENKRIQPQEIIEFPCAAIRASDWARIPRTQAASIEELPNTGSIDSVSNVKNSADVLNSTMSTVTAHQQFHRFVKPQINHKLSDFCSTLTGITQQQINSSPSFAQVFQEFLDFLQGHLGIDVNDPDTNAPAVFFTCGDWDLKTMLPSQYALTRSLNSNFMGQKSLPAIFQRWFNVKKIFYSLYPERCRKAGIESAQALEIPKMTSILGIPMKGHYHSGIDDTKNIVQIVRQMWVDGWRPTAEQLSWASQ